LLPYSQNTAMKTPKGFNKWSNMEQRQWMAGEIKKQQDILDELKKLSRQLVSNQKIIVDERPDELQLKGKL